MSVRETLTRSCSLILRLSKATIQVLMADENGLSIAKVTRSSEFDIDSLMINSVSAAAFNFSEEIWKDLGFAKQRMSFAFFEKLCLITLAIDPVLLTIVHDFTKEWPINAEEIGRILYQLKLDIDETFNSDGAAVDDVEVFSSTIRNILYLFNMGSEIPFIGAQGMDSPELHDKISNVLDSVQNPVFARYGIVNQNGLMIDGRDSWQDATPTSIEAFSATTIVTFQKLIEEAANLNSGPLLNYMTIAGADAENLYATIACPAGNMVFQDQLEMRKITSELAFVALFPLTYGMIPVFCEVKNIVHAMMELLGHEPITSAFLASVENLIQVKLG